MTIDKIYKADGSQFMMFDGKTNQYSVADHEEEQMKSNFIRVTWNSSRKYTIPVGYYITIGGVKYRLFDDYQPDASGERTFKYSPQFEHPTMWTKHIPFLYVKQMSDYEQGDTPAQKWARYDKQSEWSFSDYAGRLIAYALHFLNLWGTLVDTTFGGEFLKANQSQAEQEAGLGGWTADVDSDIANTVINISFSAVDVFSALSQIAGQLDREFHIDLSTHTLYVGNISIGSSAYPLTIGTHVGAPSVSRNKEAYCNCYVVHGGTRNLTQQGVNGDNMQSTNRLTLPSDFEGSIIDLRAASRPTTAISADDWNAIKADTNEPAITGELVMDDVYPQVKFYIYDLQERLRKRPLEGGGYSDETYATWYCRLAVRNGDSFTPYKLQDSVTAEVIAKGTNTYSQMYLVLDMKFGDGNQFTGGVLRPGFDQKEYGLYYVYLSYGTRTARVQVKPYNDGESTKVLLSDEDTAFYQNVVVKNASATPPVQGTEISFIKGVDSTKAPKENVHSDRIAGVTLQCSFLPNYEDGALESPLTGRTFDLVAYNEGDERETEHDDADTGQGIELHDGMFRIEFVEENTLVIPQKSTQTLSPKADPGSYVSNTLVPAKMKKNNIVSLIGIKAPTASITAAQGELLATAIDTIKRKRLDNNTYTVKSYPHVFNEDNISLSVGQAVTLSDGNGFSLTTHIRKLVTRLDHPSIVEITVGNEKRKGSISTLKEKVDTIVYYGGGSSSSVGGSGNGNAVSEAAVQKIIGKYGGDTFLSKTKDDTAQGLIGFVNGLWVKTLGLFGFDQYGNATVKSLTVKDDTSNPASTVASIDDNGDATLHNVTASGDLGITGDAEVGGDLDVEGDVTVGSAVTENNSTTYGGGIQSVNYSSGQALIDGNGWKLWLEQNGLSRFEVDQLTVRLKAYFAELEIRKVSHAGGNLIFSAAASKIDEVVPESISGTVVLYRCYLHTDDGTTATMNDWRVGDQALCQTFNVKSGVYQDVANKRYWRKVLYVHTKGSSENDRSYVSLAALASYSGQGLSYDNGVETGTGITNDIPAAGDTIVLLGHQYVSGSETETEAKARQNAIAIEANSDTAPAIYKYQGIDSFSMSGKLVQADYYDSTAHKYQSVTYGDWYVGAKPSNNGDPFSNDGSTYIRYRQAVGSPASPLLEIKAKIEATSGSPIMNEINSKARIFTLSSTDMASVDYQQDDIWILPEAYDGIAAGTILVCVHDKDDSLTSQDWKKKDRYTDDATFNTYISQIINGTSGTSSSAQVAQAIHAIKTALNENTSVDGGLILTNLIAMRENSNVWAGISGQYDNHIAAWFGGLMKDYEALTAEQKAQGWSVQKWAKSLFRFDGSGYLAGGNISWEDDGDTTVKGTIKADNLYHGICFLSAEGNINYLWYCKPASVYGNNSYSYINYGESYINNFTEGKYYTTEEILEGSKDEQTGKSLIQDPDDSGFLLCTGYSDLIYVLPDMANNFPDVFLPRPEDVQGKEVDVCGFYYGMPSTIPSFYVKCVENPDGTRMTNLLYYDEGILKADAPTNQIAVSAGESKRFVSVRATNGTWYWLAISMRINQEIHSSVSWSDVTSKPTTIAGYGITDAKIVGNTITLGNNTITPLTSFTESDPTVPSWAKQSSKPSYQFSEIGGSVAASQLPTLYWANVAISNQSNNNTSPQFGELRLRPGSNNYGSHLYFGDYSYCYLQEDSDDHLKIYGRTGVEITTDSGYDLTWGGYTLATQTWVGQQGYVTSSAISDMATKTWVDSQSFVTESAFSGMLENEAYISNGTIYIGGNSITPLTQHQSLSGCAQIGAHNNLTASSNEFTCAASGQSGTYYINYRTAGGSNGSITEYHFCDGAGNTLASISNGQFSGNAASADYAGALKYSGNTKVSAQNDGALVDGYLHIGNVSVAEGGSFTYYPTITFGDYNGMDVYIQEDSEDHMTIRASAGITLLDATTINDSLHFSPTVSGYDCQVGMYLSSTLFNFVSINGQQSISGYKFDAEVQAPSFKKTGSSDDNVLLGGGGTKAVTDFATWMDRPLTARGLNVAGDSTLAAPHVRVTYDYVSAGRFSMNFKGYAGDSLVAPISYIFDAPITQGSDMRLKDIIRDEAFDAESIAKMPLVTFSWKKDEEKREHFGTVAQNWEKVIPEVVIEGGDGMKSMDYGAAAMAAGVTACREVVALKKEVEELKEIIRELKNNK